jgi:hypothetical protein
MTSPSAVPSYVQGYRFSDASTDFYDAGRFKDQAGYGAAADAVVVAGTPVFATVGGHRCVKMDNTWHGGFPMPCPWQGAIVLVAKPEYVSGATLTRYCFIFGDFTTASANGNLNAQHFSGQRRFALATPSAVLNPILSRSNNDLVVVGFGHDQETRKLYSTIDGVSIAETSAASGTTSGNSVALSSAQVGVRFGDLNNSASDLTELTDMYLHLFEVHFFSENIWRRYPAEAASMMAAIRTQYGL